MKVTDLVASDRAWRGWKNTRAPVPQHRFGNPVWEAKQRELVQRALSRREITVNPTTIEPVPASEHAPVDNVKRKIQPTKP